MILRFSKQNFIISLLIGLPLIFGGNFIFAQENLAAVCEIATVENQCKTLSKADCRKLLEKCAAYYDAESSKVAADMSQTSAQKTTLKNKISGLSKKIKDLEYQINQSNLVIKDLTIQISDTESSIETTASNIELTTQKLAEILQTISEEDQKPTVEVLLAESDFSDFFNNLVYLDSLGEKGKNYLKEIKSLKINLENQKDSLDGEKDGLEHTVKLREAQKQENSQTKKDQEYHLTLTEQQYQAQLKSKQDIEKKAGEIKAKLFQMVGVSNAPTFGEALEVAKSMAATAGIRPAFLLAIISQESAIGRNVGQCVLTDTQTGAGKKIKTGVALSRVMKPTRDVTPFLTITSALGRDAFNTPVSCPLSIGYGGAMGPAQFIPSTWILYADRIKAILGKPSDPWAIGDSFLASGLYLADLGATAKTSAKESNAASRYYGGSSAYARSVMTRATCIQTFVDSGTMSGSCESLIF